MRSVETPVFTREVVKLLNDEQYHSLQLALLSRPELGRVIRRSGGIRKLRWSMTSTGKRGAIRVIYFWDEASETFLLYAYRKSAQDDLTAQQLRVLTRLVRKEF